MITEENFQKRCTPIIGTEQMFFKQALFSVILHSEFSLQVIVTFDPHVLN